MPMTANVPLPLHFSALMLMLCATVEVLADGYYQPLPLFTSSVNELNNEAIWTHRHGFGHQTTGKPENLMAPEVRFNIDQIMNDMGVLHSPKEDKLFRAQQRDSWLSTVKIIPDEHHVSAFLNKGIVKR